MLKRSFPVFAALLASGAAWADNCEPLRAKIETQISATGVTNFSVTTVDAGAAVAGEVVGSCGNGTKQIVYARGPASARVTPPSVQPAAKPRPSRDDDILTECKDGTVSRGGNCAP